PLQSLVDKSLLRHGEDGRFFMLVTIKELALEKLSGLADSAALHRARDRYFLTLAEELAERERLSAARDLEAGSRDRFDRELPNFRAALASFLRQGRPDEILRLGAALWRFWLSRTEYEDAAECCGQRPSRTSRRRRRFVRRH